MKKHKIRGKIILSLLVVLVFTFYTNVFAVEDNSKTETTIDCSGYTDEAGKKACEEKAKACINVLNEANYQFVTKLSNDEKTITFKITSSRKVTSTYKVEIKTILDNNVVKTDVLTNIEGNKNYTYTLPNVDKNKEYFVNLVTTVDSTNKTGDIDCYQQYKGTSIFSIGNVTSDEFDNPYIAADGICTQYKNGQLFGKEAYAFSKIKDKTINIEGKTMSGEEYFNQLLPYCSKAKIEYLVPGEELETQIKHAAQLVITTSKIASSSIVIDIPKEGKEVKDTSKKLSFYCDAFGTNTNGYYTLNNNVKKFYHIENKPSIYAKYLDKYEGLDSENKTKVCDVKCIEEVEASYGPPVAVKGGICFEYEITVKSKSKCSATYNKNVVVPKKTEYKLCNPVPVCNQASALYRNQAGPNEEFDQCIMELDGGKYKQSSINKCYNKVYKKKKNIKKQNSNLGLEYGIVQKVADSNMPNYCNNKNNFGGLSATAVAQSVYTMYTKGGYQGGYYVENNNKVEWKSCNSNQAECKKRKIKFIDGCYWNDYSRYYTASSLQYTTRTVMDDVYFYQANNAYRWWDYRSTYYKPKDGFKTAYYGSNSNPCNDKCVYSLSTCSKTDKYNPSDTKTSGNYEKDLEIYESAIDKCNQQIACDTTKETKYKMSVNHSIGDIKVCEVGTSDTDKNCKVWNSTNKKGDKVTEITEDKMPLKEATGTCYGDEAKPDSYQYVNVISFPGSWIRNKDGSVRYDFNDKLNKNAYTEHKNQYCVSPSAGNVNEKWWKWDQNGRLADNLKFIRNDSGQNMYQQTKDSLGEDYWKLTDDGGKNKTNGKYNIYGIIEDFGFFNWKMDFSCFYAVDNNNSTTTTKPTPTNTNGLKNSDTRTISLDDPFPAANKSSSKSSDEVVAKKMNNTTTEETANKLVDSSAGRTPGYNWSCEASNLEIKDYAIAPTALTLKIKEENSKIYDNNSGELDYKIEITSSQIKEIRKYNESHNYFDYKDNYSEQNGIRFYNSSFLSNKQYVTILDDIKPKKLCNNLKSNGTLCDNLENYIQKAKDSCIMLK